MHAAQQVAKRERVALQFAAAQLEVDRVRKIKLEKVKDSPSHSPNGFRVNRLHQLKGGIKDYERPAASFGMFIP